MSLNDNLTAIFFVKYCSSNIIHTKPMTVLISIIFFSFLSNKIVEGLGNILINTWKKRVDKKERCT